MKATLKILVPLLILVGVVFGVTFFAWNTTQPDDTKQIEGGEPPLRFTTSTRGWLSSWDRVKIDRAIELGDPDAPKYAIQDAYFQGFYEPSSMGHAAFWFENKNAKEVTLKLERVSCGACSEGAVYVIPPATTRLTLQMTALSVMPQGLFTGLPVGLAGPGALFDRSKLPPTSAHKFEDPSKVVFTIPAADDADGWSPQWGILELGFTARPPTEFRTLRSWFVSEAGPEQVGRDEFAIGFEVIEPIQVYPANIDFGTLDELSQPEPREVIVYSCTRSLADFPSPSVVPFSPAGGDPGKYLTAGKPVPVPAEELEKLSAELSDKVRKPVHASAAYRVPVILNTKLGNQRLDIGLLERQLEVAVTGIDSRKSIPVRAVARGAVWLPEGNAYDLGSFKSRDGVTNNRFELLADNPDLELSVVEGQQSPEYAQVTLEKQENLGGKGLYRVRVHIPPGKQIGLIHNGVVVFEIKGEHPQRIRIPLKGRGDL